MKHFSFLHLAALMAIMGAAVVSCKKDANPAVQDLPGKTFSIAITEQRDKATFDWSVSGGKTVNPKETIQELCVTAYNTVTLSTGGVEVNVSSSDPTVVGVEKVGSGSSSYRLVYKGGSGDNAKVSLVTIRVWNGTGSAEIAQAFNVKGLEFVDVEGLRFNYGSEYWDQDGNYIECEGETLIVKNVSWSRPPLVCKQGDGANEDVKRSGKTDFTWRQYEKPNIYDYEKETFIVDPKTGALMRFEGLEPENASFRTLTAFESEWDFYRHKTESLVAQGIIQPGEYDNWPNVTGINADVSDYIGREIWVYELGAPTYVACLSVPVSGNRTKYLYLYYNSEEDK